MDNDAVKKFLSFFGPAENLDKVPSELIDKYKGILPDEILVLWANFGFGNYGDGVLKLIDPTLFKKNLDKWLNTSSEDYIPFMINAFGDMFYFRKLTETMYEICLLSIIYRKYKHCADSISEFFNDYITDPSIIGTDLKARIYLLAEEKIGKLDNDSIYTFVPSINFGGKEDVNNIEIADAFIYQDIAYGD